MLENQDHQALDAVFHALADPTRRAILAQLAKGSARVGELAAPFEMSLPAVSKHLKVLEKSGLLRRDREGRIHRCWLNSAGLREAAAWIAQTEKFWKQRIDGSGRYLRREGPSNDDHG